MQQIFRTEGACNGGRRSLAEPHVWPTDLRTARLERVDEYEEWGSARAEPFAAFLAAVQAELFRSTITIEDTVEESFRHGFSGADSIRAVRPPITQYLRALRQVEQNVRLELVLKKDRRPKH